MTVYQKCARACAWWLFLLVAVLPGAVAAQGVTATTVPLADPDARVFGFVGGVAFAIDFDGSGKVDARINAYDLTRRAFAWRQVIRAQDHGDNAGRLITMDNDRLLVGNGPLTVLDLATGRTLWSLDCKTVGSFDIDDVKFLADGSFLLPGRQDCGDGGKRRVLRIDHATGAVRWQAEAEEHRYETSKDTKHRDFAVYSEGGASGGVPTQVIIAGERLAGVDYASGRVNWSVREKPGRFVPYLMSGLSLWMKDDQLVAYSTRDGSRAWSQDLDAPWLAPFDVGSGPDRDLLAVTWRGAHRIDRAGRAVWSVKRADNTWGQALLGSLLVLAVKKGEWAAIDVATGAARWTVKIAADGARQVDERLSLDRTGVVLIAARERPSGPSALTAIDAASGRTLWTLDRINRKEFWYAVRDSTRLFALPDDGGPVELDVRTGQVLANSPIAREGRRARRKVRDAQVGFGEFELRYSSKALSCYGPGGQVLWTRRGEKSENADLWILDQGVAVWATQDGKVELIELASGTSLHTASANKKPRVGVDEEGGHVLVPDGRTLHMLSVAGEVSSR